MIALYSLRSIVLQASQFSALRHPQFLRYWLGSFTSVGATQLQVMGLGWLVYELSQSALALGYLGAAAGFPAILTSLFGGAMADQVDKRMLLIATSLITGTLLSLLAWLDYAGLVEVWHVIAIAGLISITTGFDWPSRQAIFPALIDREDMMSAVALTTLIWQSTRMVMPAFGGIMIALSGTWLLFALCALGFYFMFFVLIGLKVESNIVKSKHSTFHQIAEGIRFIITNRTFLVLIGLSYAMFFFPASYMQLMPAFADMLQVDEKGYGYLLSVTGFGAITGTMLTGPLQASQRLGLVMLLSSVIFCVFVYGFCFAAWISTGYSFYLSLALIFCASIFTSIFMITSTSVLQLGVPEALRGRVMGFHAITYNLLPLGALFAGAIANLSNAALAVGIATSIFVVMVLVIMVTQPGIRRIDGRHLAAADQ